MMLNAILTGIPLKKFSCDYYKRFMVENYICGSEYIIFDDSCGMCSVPEFNHKHSGVPEVGVFNQHFHHTDNTM